MRFWLMHIRAGVARVWRLLCRKNRAPRAAARTPTRPPVRPPRSPIESLESREFFSAAALVTTPRYDHVVIVVEENHSYGQILRPLVPQVPIPALVLPYFLPSVLTEALYI